LIIPQGPNGHGGGVLQILLHIRDPWMGIGPSRLAEMGCNAFSGSFLSVLIMTR
jgi:hypothetical protein